MKSTLAVSTCLILSHSCLPQAFAQAQSEPTVTDENIVVVTADFRDKSVLRLPTSVSVLSEDELIKNNAHHLSDVLNLAPNVNFATGASRGRFIQVRGIGERSEFSEPVNYSVGVVLDGIDMTGIASAATLIDTQQVEVLRGPQGTLYGANGLAGLINIVSNQASAEPNFKVSAGVESHSGYNSQIVATGPITDALLYRFAVGQYASDGHMKNVFLQTDDTNNIDETSARLKLFYQPSQDFQLETNFIFADIDNGYDAFSLDSNFNTYSDEPGFDKQSTNAFSVKAQWSLDETLIQTLVSRANSDSEYGYDEDWSHPAICEGTACDSDLFGFDWWYSSFDNYIRENTNNSLDLRWLSNSNSQQSNWVVGLYARQQETRLIREYTFNTSDFNSELNKNNYALYGQVESPLGTKWSLISGLRFEKQQTDYQDNNAILAKGSENFWGGKLAIEYAFARERMFYLLLSRGYKAGGFNNRPEIPASDRAYATEFMWNLEWGVKGNWLEDRVILQSSVFYQHRKDIQSKQSRVTSRADGRLLTEGGECPCDFNDYIKNSAQGISYGLEFELQWLGWDDASVYTSVGLLHTEFKDFSSFTHNLANLQVEPPVPYNLDGRAVAHAPEYQAVVGIDYFINDKWTLTPQLELKDEFYFSDRHQLKSRDYTKLNLNLAYQAESWSLNVFVNNATNEKIQTRGFGSFGNDPRKFYETEGYFQFAAPRVYGIRASKSF
ncbi:TonB-dependent receptor [Aliikangiella sp. IMCC44653]